MHEAFPLFNIVERRMWVVGSGGRKTARSGLVHFPLRPSDVGQWDFFPAMTPLGMRSCMVEEKCVLEKLPAVTQASQATSSQVSPVSRLRWNRTFVLNARRSSWVLVSRVFESSKPSTCFIRWRNQGSCAFCFPWVTSEGVTGFSVVQLARDAFGASSVSHWQRPPPTRLLIDACVSQNAIWPFPCCAWALLGQAFRS